MFEAYLFHGSICSFNSQRTINSILSFTVIVVAKFILLRIDVTTQARATGIGVVRGGQESGPPPIEMLPMIKM